MEKEINFNPNGTRYCILYLKISYKGKLLL